MSNDINQLNKIKSGPQTSSSSIPDSKTKQELEDLDKQYKLLDLKQKQLETDQKEKIFEIILPLIEVWGVVLIILLFLEGIFGPFGKFKIFHLSDEIWIALLTGTSASIVGVLVIIVKSLYPQK